MKIEVLKNIIDRYNCFINVSYDILVDKNSKKVLLLSSQNKYYILKIYKVNNKLIQYKNELEVLKNIFTELLIGYGKTTVNSGVDQEEYAYILTTYIFNNNNNNDIKKIASSYCDFIKKVNNNNLSLIPEKDRIYGKIVEDYGLISRNNCIIHGDIHIGNIIFGDNKVFFIDFENLSYTNIAFDIAALFETCNELNIANGYNLLEFLRLFKREGLFFSVSDVLFILFEIFRFEFEGDYLWKS